MNSLYDYFDKKIDKNKLTHSFLIGNTKFNDVKDDLYKVFNKYIFDSDYDVESNPDIYIIRPEKGIIPKDAVKELIKEITTTSQFNNKKVYVIDGAEKLNEYSYNAILKTLEEPKDNIYAFLLTSNIDSIKSTIVSRCQKIFISSESSENEFDDNIISISEELIKYIENNNIKTIGLYPEMYNIIDSRETFVIILNYLLSKYFDIINKSIYNNDSNIELLSKKVLIINETINELNSYLNKNLIIDRFIIKMWRCNYENS